MLHLQQVFSAPVKQEKVKQQKQQQLGVM